MAEDKRQAAIQIIERMPEGTSFEEIMYELYFHERIERARWEAEEGKLIPHEEVKRNLAEWLKSSG